jgi:hypothetical protein
MDKNMKPGYRHATWTRTCSLDMDIQPGHDQAAMGITSLCIHTVWTWTRSMEKDIPPGHGHAAWTWTCSMDMGIHYGHYHAETACERNMDTDRQYGLGHAVWAWTCSMEMDIQLRKTCICILHLYIHIYAACPFLPCVSQHMLRVYIHAACLCPCCIFKFMLHGHGTNSRNMDIIHGLAIYGH